MEDEHLKKRTLAGASEAGLDSYLQKRKGKSTKKTSKQTEAAKRLLAASTRAAIPNDVLCGAPAQLQEEDHNLSKPAHEGRSRVEDTPISSPFWPVRRDDEDDWEEASDLGDLQEAIDQPDQADDGNLEICLGKEETKLLRPPPRKFTKKEIMTAAMSHRFHVVLLLARGQMFDQAADDALVQATALSCVPQDADKELRAQTSKGIGVNQLTDVCQWFRTNTKLQEASDGIDPNVETVSGREYMSERLRAVAASLQGSPDELVALFTAYLRGVGLLTRFVRALDPVSWKPTLREKYIPRQKRPPSNKSPSATKNSRKRKATDAEYENTEKAAAKAANDMKTEQLPDGVDQSTSAKAAASRKKQNGKARATKKGEKKPEGSSGSEEDEDGEDEDFKGKSTNAKKSQAKARTKRGKADALKEAELAVSDGSESPQTPKAGRGRGRGRGNARGRGRGRAKASAKKSGKGDAPDAENSDLPKHSPDKGYTNGNESKEDAEDAIKQEEDVKPSVKKQRLGDLEFENQIAMAMMVTAQDQKPGINEAEDFLLSEVKPRSQDSKAASKRIWQEGLSRNKESGSVWTKNANQNQVGDVWAEVYCGAEDEGKGRWVHVQPLLGWIDKPGLVENGSIRFAPLSYVVAFSGGGAKDISSRYISNIGDMQKRREPNEKWWQKTMKPLRKAEVQATNAYLSTSLTVEADLDSPEGPLKSENLAYDRTKAIGQGSESKHDGPDPDKKPSKQHGGPDPDKKPSKAPMKTKASIKAEKQEVAMRASREDQMMKDIAKKQEQIVPTSLDGFKHHKLYILQRHITRYNALRPGASMLGLYKGEPYYYRADVSELHTAEKWVTHGREVLLSELGTPAKVVQKRGTKSKQKRKLDGDAGEYAEEATGVFAGGAFAEEEDDSDKTKLYGNWQTGAWAPPKAEDGVVPKNERGNVHCPPLAPALPVGTTQINRPKIVGTCKRLDVDFALAMTGFDVRGGRSIPRFEGVVVCDEVVSLVTETWEQEQREIEEKKAQKRLEEAQQTWAQLLKAIFLRLGFQTDEDQKAPSTKSKKPTKRKTNDAKDSTGSKTKKTRIGKGGNSAEVEEVIEPGHARDNADIEDI